jgi:hypothetical protein
MNYAGCTPQPLYRFENDRCLGQLRNVFRILAKSEDPRREEAFKLRQKISFTWHIQAQQGKWFEWPTTEASPGVRKLKANSWRQQGILGFLGYHVGEMLPTSPAVRWRVLEYAFECHLPPLNGPAYFSEWGEPKTRRRLAKLANVLASLTRNAKRRDTVSFATAINDWEGDLALLHQRYYVDFFHFGWPATDALH